MPLSLIQEVDIFNVWDLDFIGPFSPSYRSQFILIGVDYVSKLAEVFASLTNNAKIVMKFLKKLFTRFKDPRAIISDGAHIFTINNLSLCLRNMGYIAR